MTAGLPTVDHPRRIWAARLARGALLLGLVLAGTGAGVAWGWASPVPTHRTFHVEARQFGYEPGILRANLGDSIAIELKTADVTHGIYIDGYGIRGKVYPGQTLHLAFVADRRGRFSIRCSETCGVFHPFMTGELVVQPNLVLPGSVGFAAGAAVGSILYAGWTSKGWKREEGAE